MSEVKHPAEADKIYLIKMCPVCEKLTNHYPKRKGAFSYLVCEKCGKEG